MRGETVNNFDYIVNKEVININAAAKGHKMLVITPTQQIRRRGRLIGSNFINKIDKGKS